MNKTLILLACILCLSAKSYAQFAFGEPSLTDGSIVCRTTTTKTTTVDGKVTSKEVTKVTFNTALKISFSLTEEKLKNLNLSKYPDKRLPNVGIANNFSRTLNETETRVTAKIPRSPTDLTYDSQTWGPDPCNYNQDAGLVKTIQLSGNGMVKDENRGVTVYISSIKDEKGNYILKVFGGGGWGNIKDLQLSAQTFKPDPENDGKCKWINSNDFTYSLLTPLTTNMFLNSTEMPDNFKRISPGFYSKEVPATEFENEYITEYNLLKIDTTQIFDYIRNKPAFKSLNAMGSYRFVSKNNLTKEVVETTEFCEVTINFGKFENDLLLSTEEDELYHNWLPVSQESSDYKTLKVKVELKSEDDSPKDTIHFYLKNVSHYPGVCTNFPCKQEGILKYAADMWFPNNPENKNIIYIDSFHVKTSEKVSGISVDIDYNDFAAYGKLEAYAPTKNVKALSHYDQGIGLTLPEDANKNFIADKWEKDVGIYDKSLPPLDDSDNFPEYKAGDNGDGFSLYEEYRGFYAKKDFCKKPENVFRKGDHIRTDPKNKDVFFYDDTQIIFEKYYALNNPAEINWHSLTETQVVNYNSAIVKNELGKSKGLSIGFANELNKYENRFLNYNTTASFQIKKHYSLYLVYSTAIDSTISAGQSLLTPDVNVEKITPIEKNELITFQNEGPFYYAIKKACPYRIFCSKYPATCDFFCTSMHEMFVCPQCSSITKCTKLFTPSEENTIAQNQYIAAVIHEIGHGIGIGHHINGEGKLKDENNKNAVVTEETVNEVVKRWVHVTKETVNEIKLQYGESSDEYKKYDDALCACGMADCAMKYGFQEINEFITKQILNVQQTKYCKKGPFYFDLFGVSHPSDDCFSKINVK
ncbi:MAG: hypothetical protein HXX09_02890 [Bacteroidetes bacterium]|nr:hypothetical protein [Bacteroidota bacterium]